jgi:hypothetical protein
VPAGLVDVAVVVKEGVPSRSLVSKFSPYFKPVYEAVKAGLGWPNSLVALFAFTVSTAGVIVNVPRPYVMSKLSFNSVPGIILCVPEVIPVIMFRE